MSLKPEIPLEEKPPPKELASALHASNLTLDATRNGLLSSTLYLLQMARKGDSLVTSANEMIKLFIQDLQKN